jgi:hypothetical protein
LSAVLDREPDDPRSPEYEAWDAEDDAGCDAEGEAFGRLAAMLPATAAGAWAFAQYLASVDRFGGRYATEQRRTALLRVVAWLT